MRTLSLPTRHEKDPLVAKAEYDSGVEAEKSFILEEFDLIQAKAESEGIDVRDRQIVRGLDSSLDVADTINSIPFNAAAFIEIGPPVNEGPVKVTRIFVVKRRDPELEDDTVTTFFQLDFIRNNGTEELESSVLFSEATDGDVAMRSSVNFDGETGQIEGHEEMVKGGKIKKLPDLNPSACNKDIRQAVETLDQPVFEVVERATGEFNVVKVKDEGMAVEVKVVDTKKEKRGLFESAKLSLKLGKDAAKDAFDAARSQADN